MELILQNVLIGYGIGALAWTLILGFTRTPLTLPRLVGIALWPLPLVHWIGSGFRVLFP